MPSTGHEAHVEFDENLTKAEASRLIDELQQVTGRGRRAEGGTARDRDPQGIRARGGDGESANPGSAGTSGDEETLSIGAAS